MIKSITVRGLADYMTADEAKKRKIVEEFKYPKDDEAKAKIIYYKEAKDRIITFHKENKDIPWLLNEVKKLETKAIAAPKARTKTRLKSNAKALKHYLDNFSGRKFTVIDNEKFSLVYGDITVKVRPDMTVIEKGKEKIIKLECSSREIPEEEIKIISQTAFEATRKAGKGYISSSVIYLDICGNRENKGAKLGARMARNIEAACHSISDIWDKV